MLWKNKSNYPILIPVTPSYLEHWVAVNPLGKIPVHVSKHIDLDMYVLALILSFRNNYIYQIFQASANNAIRPGPGCSKLTMSLVNVLLKFQTLISQICQYLLLKKCEKLLQCKSFSVFSTKNISVFGYKVVKHLAI